MTQLYSTILRTKNELFHKGITPMELLKRRL